MKKNKVKAIIPYIGVVFSTAYRYITLYTFLFGVIAIETMNDANHNIASYVDGKESIFLSLEYVVLTIYILK